MVGNYSTKPLPEVVDKDKQPKSVALKLHEPVQCVNRRMHNCTIYSHRLTTQDTKFQNFHGLQYPSHNFIHATKTLRAKSNKQLFYLNFSMINIKH